MRAIPSELQARFEDHFRNKAIPEPLLYKGRHGGKFTLLDSALHFFEQPWRWLRCKPYVPCYLRQRNPILPILLILEFRPKLITISMDQGLSAAGTTGNRKP
jgi:hypothetical protein